MSDEIIQNSETQMFITGENITPPEPTTFDLETQKIGKQLFADPMSMPTGSLLPGIYWPSNSPLNGSPNGVDWRADAIFTSARIPGVPDAWPGTFAFYRIMLADPTVRLARAVANAPILSSAWSVDADETAPDGAKELIESNLVPMRRKILQSMILAMDLGYVGFEKIFETVNGQIILKSLKQLLHEITVILVDGQTGDWTGFANRNIELPVEKCMIFVYDQEAANLYGRSKLENLRGVIPAWKDANNSAATYDHKISGVFPVVHYPPGSSRNVSGTPKDNYEIATSVLHNISAGQGIAVPNEFASSVDDRNSGGPEKRRWLIELLEDKGSRQPGFIARLEYLDKLKMRGYLVPERAATEGQHGTKAEAETHGDLVTQISEIVHADIVQTLNEQLVDQLLTLNYGSAARGTVRLKAMPVVNVVRQFVRDVVKSILTQGNSAAEIMLSTVNLESMLDMAEIPMLEKPESQKQILTDVEGQNAEPVKMHIRKLSSGSYRLYSKKKVNGKYRNLGTFKTLEEAQIHERSVEMFKHLSS